MSRIGNGEMLFEKKGYLLYLLQRKERKCITKYERLRKFHRRILLFFDVFDQIVQAPLAGSAIKN